MTSEDLLLRLIAGDPTAETAVAEQAETADDVGVLVAAAVISGATRGLDRADRLATRTRDRQLVALARTHLEGSADVFDVLVRDHLAAYPDHLLAAWLAARVYLPAAATGPAPHRPTTS
jgi:hypothetical protein